MGKLDTRTKIAIVAMLSVLVFLMDGWETILAVFALSLLLWRSAGLRFRDLYARAAPLRYLFVFMILSQAVFFPGGDIYRGLAYGLVLSLRVLTLACTLPLLTATSSAEEIVLALTRLGLPYRTAYMATTALNQVPVLRADIASIIAAQRLRGSDAFERGRGRLLKRLRAYPSLVVPLVMTSMRRAALMGTAMDARAFGCARTRSSIHSAAFAPVDAAAFVLALAVSAALFFVARAS